VLRKEGDPVALAREARGARIAGPPLAPRVITTGRGVIDYAWVAGQPRPLEDLATGPARALGRMLARVHARRATSSGGLPGWPSRARDLRAYVRGRMRDALGRTATRAERDLVHHVARRLLMTCPADGAFAFLHGDLVTGNILWPASAPVLVDWEFWRMGDPAEDLAYVVAMNDMSAASAAAVHAGYGATGDLIARARAWEPMVLADAALWLRAHGEPGWARRLLARADAAAA